MTLKHIKLKLGIGKCDRPKSIYAPNIIHMVISISYIASYHGVNTIILEMTNKFFEVKISKMLSSIAQGIFDA